jgi:hypothetical protein
MPPLQVLAPVLKLRYYSHCWLPAANGCEVCVEIRMWDTSEYCWVVICKNHRFHHHKNQLYGHRIPLGETDAFTPRPALAGRLVVRCDECGQEYSYEPAEVLRYEEVFPDSVTPHPLFR